jgi:hypothetical protein
VLALSSIATLGKLFLEGRSVFSCVAHALLLVRKESLWEEESDSDSTAGLDAHLMRGFLQVRF